MIILDNITRILNEMYLCSCTVRRIEFSVSQFSDISHIIHESVIGLIVSSWWRFKACITSTQESVLSPGTRPLAGLKALVFVVARVRNSEARKEITLNTFTLYREKWWLPSTEVSIQTQIYSNLLTQTNFFFKSAKLKKGRRGILIDTQ